MEERVFVIFDVIYIKNGNDVKVMKIDYFYVIYFFRKRWRNSILF